ncbi:MAG: AbrB/MazE/SpoVT family DNA-binding domain-containing protein [Nanoarchaeota archaeon]
MDVAITRMSSKGQVVIPAEMREGINEGDKLVIIKNDHQLIMKKASDFDTNLKDDIEFARRTEEAWKRYGKDEFKSLPANEFIKLLKKC